MSARWHGYRRSFRLEDGDRDDALKIRLNDLESLQASLRQQLQTAASPAPVVRLHPDAATLYAVKVAELQTTLDQPDIRVEAMEVLRTLIEWIVLTPDDQPSRNRRPAAHAGCWPTFF